MNSADTTPMPSTGPQAPEQLTEKMLDVRGGIQLRARWQWQGSRRVKLWLDQVAGPGAPHHSRGEVDLDGVSAFHETFVARSNPQHVTLKLVPAGAFIDLVAQFPRDRDTAVDRVIDSRPVGPAPIPPAPPDPPSPPEPGPPSPPEGGDSSIDPLTAAADQLPFVWMRAPSRAERADARLRYLRYERAASLGEHDLVDQLGKAEGAAARRAAATQFRTTTLFVGALAQLPWPMDLLPSHRLTLLADDGHRGLAWLDEQVATLLGQPAAGFLAAHALEQERVWQSVIAVALVGTPADAALAEGLLDSLRVLGYLGQLAAREPALQEQAPRRLLLRATPSLPGVAAACPLQGETDAGAWCLLGVGELEMARHAPQGYALGEVAEVLNLMPRERQERHEHLRQSLELRDAQDRSHRELHGRQQQADAASELADALRAAFRSEGLVQNLSGVTPSYGNLNMMLSGTAASGGGTLDAKGVQAAQLVQRTTERAAREVSDRGSQQRTEVWREWREQHASRCIDNHDGARLVGVYRWVDRLVQVCLQPQGPRLVLAFHIDSPARAWLAQVAAAGPVPLVRPQPLPAFGVADGQGFQQILPGNYQSLGARYGLTDLPSPPPEVLCISAQFNRSALADDTQLCVPPGYEVAGGSATLSLADTRYSLVASVGGAALQVPTQQASPALGLTVPSAASSTEVGALAVSPPAPGVAWLGTTVFKAGDGTGAAPIGLTGRVPVTVMSDAPRFALSVVLECRRSTLAGTGGPAVDPLLQAWQMAVYDRLLGAWHSAARAYDAKLAQRAEAAGDGRRELIQRQVLRAACLGVLGQASASAGPEPYASGVDWSAMNWHYEDDAVPAMDLYSAGEEGEAGERRPPAGPDGPASAKLFRRFLCASSARVLVPLKPRLQAAVLFALQWQASWPQPLQWADAEAPADVPVSDATVWLLEEQRDAEPPPVRLPWTLRLPLPLIYLQQGDALPGCAPGMQGERA